MKNPVDADPNYTCHYKGGYDLEYDNDSVYFVSLLRLAMPGGVALLTFILFFYFFRRLFHFVENIRIYEFAFVTLSKKLLTSRGVMRKLLLLIALCASICLAQIGIVHSESGIHAPSAATMGQGILYISGSYEMVSDGKAPSLEGYYLSDGTQVEMDNNTPSNDESLFISFGVLDNLDLGLMLPVHYDGFVPGKKINGFGLGDVQLNAKGSFPVTEWLQLGLGGEILIPTGSDELGFRPRHRWYIKKDGDAYAYTSDSWALGGNAYLSIRAKDCVTFNSYAGLLKGFGKDDEIYMLWGGSFNVLPEKLLTLILEISGETPLRTSKIQRNVLNSPFRLTPALRLHLPHDAYFTISGDVGLNYFRDDDVDNGLPVHMKSSKSTMDYTVSGSPFVSVGVTLSKKFDLSWSDSDNDGVIDRKDMCPGTRRNQVVNARGCPVDEDQDGVLNIVDMCPGTPLGIVVGRNGCPLDFDHDGVFDYLDKCLGTPAGFAVDSLGCTLDTDGDGIDDNNDKCPNTTPGDPVDGTGCPLDQDHDGVPNSADMCPNTPANVSIDLMGCPLDYDRDGVPDDFDLCPNSVPNEIVDSLGCPLDSDKDGVPDSRDSCANTPEGVGVDMYGCRVDQDADGIFDEEDKCPNTPENAPIDSLGCPIDSDHDGVADWMDACPGTLSRVVVDHDGCPMNSRLNFNYMAQRIKFKPGDTTLVNSSYTALSDVIAAMRQHPMLLEIQCAANDVPQKQSAELSEARARSIYNFLEKKGIHKDRLTFKGYGSKLPPTQTQKNGSTAHIRLVPVLIKTEE